MMAERCHQPRFARWQKRKKSARCTLGTYADTGWKRVHRLFECDTTSFSYPVLRQPENLSRATARNSGRVQRTVVMIATRSRKNRSGPPVRGYADDMGLASTGNHKPDADAALLTTLRPFAVNAKSIHNPKRPCARQRNSDVKKYLTARTNRRSVGCRWRLDVSTHRQGAGAGHLILQR